MRGVHVATQSEIRIRKLLPVSSQDVFDAWTDSESLTVWFCTRDSVRTEAEMDLRGEETVLASYVNGFRGRTLPTVTTLLGRRLSKNMASI